MGATNLKKAFGKIGRATANPLLQPEVQKKSPEIRL